MNTTELIKYELPTWVEFVSNDFLQELIAKHYARKVEKKYRRYLFRLERDKLFKRFKQ